MKSVTPALLVFSVSVDVFGMAPPLFLDGFNFVRWACNVIADLHSFTTSIDSPSEAEDCVLRGKEHGPPNPPHCHSTVLRVGHSLTVSLSVALDCVATRTTIHFGRNRKNHRQLPCKEYHML